MSAVGERTFALVGPGRAGTTIAVALVDAGWRACAVAGRTPDATSTGTLAGRLVAPTAEVADVGREADLVVIATPDASIEAAALELAPGLRDGALVIHLSGARGIDALRALADARPDVEVGALHPLQTLPSSLQGAWAAVAGPDVVSGLAIELGLRPFHVPDEHRAAYHATACVASNHLVALLGQVERLAATVGVPVEAFAPLVRATVDNVFALGAPAALTGPVARGDLATVAAHLDALPADERPAYGALATAAHRLSGRDDDELTALLDGVTT